MANTYEIIDKEKQINEYYNKIIKPINITFYQKSHTIDKKRSSSELDTKNSVKPAAKTLLSNSIDNIIDAKDFLNTIKSSINILSRIRYTTYRKYKGNYTNGGAITYSLVQTITGNGQFVSKKDITNVTNYIDNVIKTKDIVNSEIINEFFETLKIKYNNWVASQNQKLYYYACHTNCHSSRYSRSRR